MLDRGKIIGRPVYKDGVLVADDSMPDSEAGGAVAGDWTWRWAMPDRVALPTTPGRYVAFWGGHRVVVEVQRHGGCSARIYRESDGTLLVEAPDLPRLSGEAAVAWAGVELERRGCTALVSGRRFTVAAFLSFSPT